MMNKHITIILRRILIARIYGTRFITHGERGSGAGKGGGGGGSIRDAGGAFGALEAAREDEYFYKKQKEQLLELKKHIKAEMEFHKEQIKLHEDALRRSHERVREFDKKH